MDPERHFLLCTSAGAPGATSECTFETKRYASRELASMRKELGDHAVSKHAKLQKVRIVTERREEVVS